MDRLLVGAVGHSFAALVGCGMARCDRAFAVGEINQMGRSRRAGSGIMTLHDPRPPRVLAAHAAVAGAAGRQRMW